VNARVAEWDGANEKRLLGRGRGPRRSGGHVNCIGCPRTAETKQAACTRTRISIFPHMHTPRHAHVGLDTEDLQGWLQGYASVRGLQREQVGPQPTRNDMHGTTSTIDTCVRTYFAIQKTCTTTCMALHTHAPPHILHFKRRVSASFGAPKPHAAFLRCCRHM